MIKGVEGWMQVKMGRHLQANLQRMVQRRATKTAREFAIKKKCLPLFKLTRDTRTGYSSSTENILANVYFPVGRDKSIM